ncbi:MAG: FAD-dependent oxidoreductase [Myxococcales bacterium]|nr:FAD-dependent oxidoreductase [Myxococcales bacterium]
MAPRLGLLPRVCVIGAGCSGLTAVKALREVGVPHTCFEMSDRVGGNWVFGNKNGRSGAYRSLHINTSRQCMEFRDFPMPDHLPDFPHHRHVAAYFESYARHFGLHETIRFEHEVLSCRPLAGSPPGGAGALDAGGWAVTVRDLKTGKTQEHLFDGVLVANGHHWDPAWPDPPPPGSFHGEVLHSHGYVDPTTPLDLRGKRVVVVGMGNSAMDIAAELCRPGVAERLFLSSRRGAWILPKYIRGKPLDQGSLFPHWLPGKLRRRLVTRGFTLLFGRMSDYGLPEPDHLLGEAHPTVSSEVPSLTGSGDIVPKPAIERLDGHEVQFTDGSRERIDAIVYCTGYHVSFPFFAPEVLSAPGNELPLFFRVFERRYQGLGLIGFAQPLGAIMPIAEQQARWAAAYFAGSYALPSLAEMDAAIEAEAAAIRERFVASRRHTFQLEPAHYLPRLQREWERGRARARRGTGRAFRFGAASGTGTVSPTEPAPRGQPHRAGPPAAPTTGLTTALTTALTTEPSEKP